MLLPNNVLHIWKLFAFLWFSDGAPAVELWITCLSKLWLSRGGQRRWIHAVNWWSPQAPPYVREQSRGEGHMVGGRKCPYVTTHRCHNRRAAPMNICTHVTNELSSKLIDCLVRKCYHWQMTDQILSHVQVFNCLIFSNRRLIVSIRQVLV